MGRRFGYLMKASRSNYPFYRDPIVNLIRRETNDGKPKDGVEIILWRAVASRQRQLDEVDERAQEKLNDVENQ